MGARARRPLPTAKRALAGAAAYLGVYGGVVTLVVLLPSAVPTPAKGTRGVPNTAGEARIASPGTARRPSLASKRVFGSKLPAAVSFPSTPDPVSPAVVLLGD